MVQQSSGGSQGLLLQAFDNLPLFRCKVLSLLLAISAAGHAGSSEAILSGQKPPFRLLVRAMSRDTGARLSNIRFAVSEPFVVSTS